jgi:hypothetical protein
MALTRAARTIPIRPVTRGNSPCFVGKARRDLGVTRGRVGRGSRAPRGAVAALTGPGHAGQVYELTDPRLLTFADAVAEIAQAAEREIRYLPVSLEDFAARAADHGTPAELVELLTYLFGEVLGNNPYITDGVQRALGRPPGDFTAYASRTAATGVWTPSTDR